MEQTNLRDIKLKEGQCRNRTKIIARLVYPVNSGEFTCFLKDKLVGTIAIYGTGVKNIGYDSSHLIQTKDEFENVQKDLRIKRYESDQYLEVEKWTFHMDD